MATVTFDIPDDLAQYAIRKGVFSSEWIGQLARDALAKMPREEQRPSPPRIGFLQGRISVPPDFDTMGQNEIAALFNETG